MTTLRHPARHVHKTIVERVRQLMQDTNWMEPPINFGAKQVFIQEIEPADPTTIEPNMLAITIGGTESAREVQLGDGLMVRTWALYLDVFGESWSITTAIVEDLLEGLAGARWPVRDYAHGNVETEHMIHIDELDVDVPPAAGQIDRSTWRVVTGTVEVYFTGES